MNFISFLLGLFLVICILYTFTNAGLYEGYGGYGPEYSTNNPEGAPWDISSPFYQQFWGYYPGNNLSYYGWY